MVLTRRPVVGDTVVWFGIPLTLTKFETNRGHAVAVCEDVDGLSERAAAVAEMQAHRARGVEVGNELAYVRLLLRGKDPDNNTRDLVVPLTPERERELDHQRIALEAEQADITDRVRVLDARARDALHRVKTRVDLLHWSTDKGAWVRHNVNGLEV